MKKIIPILLCIISILSINTISASAKEPDKTTCTLYLNNSKHSTVGYVIDGETYYKMNDISSVNYGRADEKRINVRFNEADNCIEAYYSAEVSVPFQNIVTTDPIFLVYEGTRNNYGFEETYWSTHDIETGEKTAIVTANPYVNQRDKIYRPRKGEVNIKTIDGESYSIVRYAIDKSFYYNLNDLAKLFNCAVEYSDDHKACFVISDPTTHDIYYSETTGLYFMVKDTDKYFKVLPDVYGFPTRGLYTSGFWADPVPLQIYDNGDDTFSTLGIEPVQGESNTFYTVRTYRKSDFTCIDSKKFCLELDYFCGFFSGKKYNYAGFGAYNSEEIPDKEILRIVKYDKNLNRLAELSLTTEQCFSIAITRAGTMRMAENGSELVVHTSRLRRKTNDGLNHQSQLSLVIDTDTMTTKNYTGEFQSNHVSHSFNQFVKYDGDEIVYLDHGDGYPRAIALNSSLGKKINLYDIPGEIGDNFTGVFVGGFEISPKSYLVTFNTEDFTSGLSGRNPCLAVCDKKTQETKIITLSECFGKDITVSAPYLLKASDDRFIVLWSEEQPDFSSITKYVEIDGYGNFLTEIKSSDKQLYEVLEPMYMDNAIYWYRDFFADLTTPAGRLFYKLDLDSSKENPISVMYNGEKIQFDQPPIAESGRTLVPLRAIFEKIGADVDWDGNTQTVTATKGDITISLTMNDTTAYKNRQAITLDVPAKALNGRTLVPVRFVSDCFGVDVDWVQETQTVILTSK